MQEIIHNVLGTPYKVQIGEDVKIQDDFIGWCKIYSKDILISTKNKEFSDEELRVRVQEVVAHELFHAYLNESGLQIDENVEELIADFFMKNWRKISNSIFEVLDETGFLE